MIFHLQKVIDPGTLAAIRERLGNLPFQDGADTVGWAARGVKHNDQASDVRSRAAIVKLVEQKLRSHDLFASIARPKAFPRLLINRYGPGMSYGTHVDDSLINHLRTDLSFTLSLSPVAEYEGGELVLEDSTGERCWKLDAGDLLLYPATYLHRVEEVSTGQRLAVVGWVRSYVRHAWQREILLDLDISMREEFETRGKSAQFDRLSNVRNNLMRFWVED